MENGKTELVNCAPSATTRKLTVRTALMVIMVMVLAVPGFCTDPDFAGVVTGFKTDVTTMLTTYGPLVISLMVTVLGWKFITRWIRKSVKGI